MTQPTRPSLLVRLRQPEDSSAWSEFVTIYGPLLAGWCRQRGLQNSDAEDVAQTVLLRLAKRIATFSYDPDRGSFRAYLRTLARYAINDFFTETKEKGSGDTRVLSALESVAATTDLLARLDEAFDYELLNEALHRVRNRVEEQTWAAFELTAFQGLPTDSVAQQLHLSMATIYKAKSRILNHLREEIALLDPDQDSINRVASLVSHS